MDHECWGGSASYANCFAKLWESHPRMKHRACRTSAVLHRFLKPSSILMINKVGSWAIQLSQIINVVTMAYVCKWIAIYIYIYIWCNCTIWQLFKHINSHCWQMNIHESPMLPAFSMSQALRICVLPEWGGFSAKRCRCKERGVRMVAWQWRNTTVGLWRGFSHQPSVTVADG